MAIPGAVRNLKGEMVSRGHGYISLFAVLFPGCPASGATVHQLSDQISRQIGLCHW